jgi:hypothetical protein
MNKVLNKKKRSFFNKIGLNFFISLLPYFIVESHWFNNIRFYFISKIVFKKHYRKKYDKKFLFQKKNEKKTIIFFADGIIHSGGLSDRFRGI